MAQPDMIGYGLYKTLPQANNLNPAMLPDYKVSIGLPGLSGFRLNASQNFSNLEKLNAKDEEGRMILSDIYDGLNRNNRIATANTLNLFHLGIRGVSGYTAFSINSRVEARTNLPKGIFSLLYHGNSSNQIEDGLIDLNRISAKTMAFTEIAISHGREILSGKMTAGIRLKYLIGHNYSALPGLDASLRTYGNDSFRGDSITFTSNGFDAKLGGISGAVAVGKDNEADIINAGLRNSGIAVDLGATYKFSRKINFFASLNDLGFINWNQAYAYQANIPSASYTFSGLDVIELLNGQNLSVVRELDSLVEQLDIVEIKDESFSSALTARLYAGASYAMTHQQTASAILYTELYRGRLIPALTAMYNFHPGTFFNFAFSGTVMNNRFNNFGTGITLNLVPFQLVLATNDLLSIINPMKGRSLDFRFGINHTFGNINKGKSKAKRNSNDTIETIDLGID